MDLLIYIFVRAALCDAFPFHSHSYAYARFRCLIASAVSSLLLFLCQYIIPFSYIYIMLSCRMLLKKKTTVDRVKIHNSLNNFFCCWSVRFICSMNTEKKLKRWKKQVHKCDLAENVQEKRIQNEESERMLFFAF